MGMSDPPVPTGGGGGARAGQDAFVVYDEYPSALPPLDRERVVVYFDSGLIVIGPAERPGRTGCTGCLLNRRLLARSHGEAWDQLKIDGALPRFDHELSGVHDGLPELVAACHDELLQPGEDPSVVSYYTIRVHDGVVTRRRLEPDPLCARCRSLPVDEPRRFPTGSVRKRRRGDTRAGKVDLETLRARYVDDYAGLLPRIEVGEAAGLQVARAPVGIRGTFATEAGWGRSTTADGAQATAALEALERWCGLAPGRVSAAGTWTFDEAPGEALDVRSTGVPFDVGYGSRIIPFSGDVPCRWVWAASITEDRSVLVPEGFAYYGNTQVNVGDPQFVYEISNGCALGGSLQEASLFGALEVVERDALLLAWYTRAELDRLCRATASESTQALWEHLESTNQCRIVAWDLRSPTGLPAVWVMAIRDRTTSADGRLLARSVSASSCRTSYDEALVSALCELGPILSSVDSSYPQHTDRIAAMLADPAEVRDMSDHALLYAHPDAFSRFDHLDTEAAAHGVDIRARDARHAVELDIDLTRDLDHVIERLVSAGLPTVLVVDQTALDLEGSGLFCAKVIVPGAIPMTFGHLNRRLRGLPRLDAALAGRDPTSDPHPFP
ncbi:hypothetical protein D8M35_00545 [Curtobacterium sp. HSID17257]|nr:hypothetical protein D8M35_00545 [Curtobacterium sp. HSID17257]